MPCLINFEIIFFTRVLTPSRAMRMRARTHVCGQIPCIICNRNPMVTIRGCYVIANARACGPNRRLNSDRLFLCCQYVGTIISKNRMRTTFAEFEEILIADWQYDELEIPFKSSIITLLRFFLRLHSDMGGFCVSHDFH